MSTISWDDLRILLAVHRDQSFLVAGRTLGLAASTVARRIDALEQTAGRLFVHRGNGGTRLDPDALPLVALGEQIESNLDALRRDTRAADVTGIVRVSLSEGFVKPVTRVLARLRVKHPGLAIELLSEWRLVDLARREADIGIRITRTKSPNVISKLMGRAPTSLFAAREYVERRLPSARLSRDAAAQHDWVGFDQRFEAMAHEKWIRAYGATRFTFRSNSSVAIEEAVLSGMGIGLLTEMQGLALDGLVRLDLDDSPPPVDVFIAFHRDLGKTPRVRAVVRELEIEMRRQLA